MLSLSNQNVQNVCCQNIQCLFYISAHVNSGMINVCYGFALFSNSQNVSAKPQIRSGWTFLYVSTLFLSRHSAVVEKTAYSGLENILVWIEIPVLVATST